MMIALYSINLRIMGRPNVPLISEPTVFTILQPEGISDYIVRPLILLVLVIAIKFALDWYFSTKAGLAMRATGSNPRMARSQGVATGNRVLRSEEHTSELQSLMRISYAVFCLKKK